MNLGAALGSAAAGYRRLGRNMRMRWLLIIIS